jgi:hypothetical protein
MKKTVLTIAALIIFLAAQAGDKTTWQEYAGLYVFPGETMVEPVEIALQSDSILTLFSAFGEIVLTPVETDRFEFPQYGGVIIFERDEKQQVTACRISVTAMNTGELKANKKIEK